MFEYYFFKSTFFFLFKLKLKACAKLNYLYICFKKYFQISIKKIFSINYF